MILFLYGEDTYRSARKLGEIRAKFLRDVDPSGLNLAELDAKEGVPGLHAAIVAAPFLAAKRLVVAKGFLEEAGKDADDLVELLARVPEETILTVFEKSGAEDLDGSPAYARLKGGKFYPEFSPLAPASLRAWVTDEAKIRGAAFDEEALKAYLQSADSDLWKISGELDAMCAAARAVGGKIDATVVRDHTDARRDGSVFDFLDAVGTRRTGLAAELLETLLLQGESEVALLSRVQTHVRSLLLCADMAASGAVTKERLTRELGVHPFAAAKILAQQRYFDVDELKRLYTWTFEADIKLKTGGWPMPRLALDLFLLEAA